MPMEVALGQMPAIERMPAGQWQSHKASEGTAFGVENQQQPFP